MGRPVFRGSVDWAGWDGEGAGVATGQRQDQGQTSRQPPRGANRHDGRAEVIIVIPPRLLKVRLAESAYHIRRMAIVSSAKILNAHILVVDDVEANVTLMERLLLDAGYTSVSSTRNPEEVCELQRRHRFSLIILDLQMPGMDGFQVLEALKEVEDDYLPVLVLTALPAYKLRALRDGAKDFISKPFDVPEMLIRVHNMLEVRLLHEAARDHGKAQESLALTDPLTGLANRRLLVEQDGDGHGLRAARSGQHGGAVSGSGRLQGHQ